MSPARMRRLHRESRHLCAGCKEQPARFQFRGRVRADRDHNLCFRCFRAEVNRLRARRLVAVSTARSVPAYLAVSQSSVSSVRNRTRADFSRSLVLTGA